MVINVQVNLAEGDDWMGNDQAAQAMFDAVGGDPTKDTITLNTTAPVAIIGAGTPVDQPPPISR